MKTIRYIKPNCTVALNSVKYKNIEIKRIMCGKKPKVFANNVCCIGIKMNQHLKNLSLNNVTTSDADKVTQKEPQGLPGAVAALLFCCSNFK